MKFTIASIHYTFLLVSLFFAGIGSAMDESSEKYEGNTYKNDLISVETLAALAQTHTPLPEHIENELQQWLCDYIVPCAPELDDMTKSDSQITQCNQDLVATLAQLPQDLSQARAKNEYNQKLIKTIGMTRTVHPSLNYIFEPVDGVILRIAGIANRLHTIISGQDRGDKWLDPYGKEGESFLKNPESRKDLIIMPTYQTISMYTNHLLLKKIIAENKLTHVITPDTYLVHIPNKPEEVSDDNYMVVQKKIDGELINVLAHPCAWEKFSDEAIKDLFIAARVGLWNINGNLLVDADGNCVILDLEQPNNSDPRAFFNKPMVQEWGAVRGRGAFARYIVDGIELIAQMMDKAQETCPSTTEKLALWKLLIQHNNDLVRHLNAEQQERLDALGQQ